MRSRGNVTSASNDLLIAPLELSTGPASVWSRSMWMARFTVNLWLRLRIAREMLIDAVIRESLEAVTIVRAYRQIREWMAEREVADYEGALVLETARAARHIRNGCAELWVDRWSGGRSVISQPAVTPGFWNYSPGCAETAK